MVDGEPSFFVSFILGRGRGVRTKRRAGGGPPARQLSTSLLHF